MVTFRFGIESTFLCLLSVVSRLFGGGNFTMSLAVAQTMGKLSEHISYETANAISNLNYNCLQQLALRFCWLTAKER